MQLDRLQTELERLGMECDRVPNAVLVHYAGWTDYGMGIIPHSIDSETIFECYSFETYGGSVIRTTYQTSLQTAIWWGLIQICQMETRLTNEIAAMENLK